MLKFQEEKSKRKLESLRRQEEEESTKLLAKKYKIPYLDPKVFPIDLDALRIVPEEKARAAELVVFQAAGKSLKIGVRKPDKEETQNLLSRLKEDRYTFDLFLISRSSLEYAWEFYRKIPPKQEVAAGIIQISNERIQELQKELRELASIKKRIEQTFTARTTEALEVILAGAMALDASDIHIEPAETKARLRYRIDGILIDIIYLPPKVYNLLLSRLKLVAELKLNIHDKPQDGRFTIRSEEVDIEVRASTLPGPYGENVVLRILHPKAIQIPFEELGMQPQIIEIMDRELKKPNGMIITTGPTGSGKTTTLYAFLRKIYVPGIKIITIEDPIEYHLRGIEQTQIDPEKGYDFSNSLRSVVRQDPDVIMVGEVRDLETAEAAMHAALTGHLVLSTLHTNSAAGTIPRLLDLGVKPAIIAPAINVAMAQRLVRKLCPVCRQPLELTPEERTALQKELDGFPKTMPVPAPQDWQIFKAKIDGCSACSGMGYKGRIGVFEIILIDERVEQLILKEPSEFEIKKEAEHQGQITMRQDGLLKVLAGITDFAELERMVGAA